MTSCHIAGVEADINRTLGTDIVTIYVGLKQKMLSAHKRLICDRSDYFSKAFNGKFEEAKGTMYLPDEDIDAFDSFITYLYQDRLPRFLSTAGPDENDFEAEKLYPLFVPAEKFCMNELANKVMDAIQDSGHQHETIPGPPSIGCIYKNTHETSKLRIYCVLMRLYDLHASTDAEQSNETADLASDLPEFASDLIKLQFKYKHRFQKGNVADAQVRDDQEGFGRCFFHTHAKGETCHLDDVISGSK